MQGYRKTPACNGVLFVRGNAEQQAYVVELIREFTGDWAGPLPKAPSRLSAPSTSVMLITRAYSGGDAEAAITTVSAHACGTFG